MHCDRSLRREAGPMIEVAPLAAVKFHVTLTCATVFWMEVISA